MTTFTPDSYCGLYCGACDILNLHRASLETGTPAKWEDLPLRFRKHLHQAEVACQGCKSEVLFEGCKRCAIRICASGKSVEACVECPEYPCPEVKKMKGYVAGGLKDLLPHTKAMFRDMEAIRVNGIEHWKQEQAERWRCPACGTPFTWYQETCAKCGREVETVKDYRREP
jgi:hypothetical protein